MKRTLPAQMKRLVIVAEKTTPLSWRQQRLQQQGTTTTTTCEPSSSCSSSMHVFQRPFRYNYFTTTTVPTVDTKSPAVSDLSTTTSTTTTTTTNDDDDDDSHTIRPQAYGADCKIPFVPLNTNQEDSMALVTPPSSSHRTVPNEEELPNVAPPPPPPPPPSAATATEQLLQGKEEELALLSPRATRMSRFRTFSQKSSSLLSSTSSTSYSVSTRTEVSGTTRNDSSASSSSTTTTSSSKELFHDDDDDDETPPQASQLRGSSSTVKATTITNISMNHTNNNGSNNNNNMVYDNVPYNELFANYIGKPNNKKRKQQQQKQRNRQQQQQQQQQHDNFSQQERKLKKQRHYQRKAATTTTTTTNSNNNTGKVKPRTVAQRMRTLKQYVPHTEWVIVRNISPVSELRTLVEGINEHLDRVLVERQGRIVNVDAYWEPPELSALVSSSSSSSSSKEEGDHHHDGIDLPMLDLPEMFPALRDMTEAATATATATKGSNEKERHREQEQMLEILAKYNLHEDAYRWIDEARIIFSPFGRPGGWKIKFANRSVTNAFLNSIQKNYLMCAWRIVTAEEWTMEREREILPPELRPQLKACFENISADPKIRLMEPFGNNRRFYDTLNLNIDNLDWIDDSVVRVENCDKRTNERDLIHMFSRYDLKSPSILRWEAKASNGFEGPPTFFVRFVDAAWARAAIREKQGHVICGKPIRLVHFPRQFVRSKPEQQQQQQQQPPTVGNVAVWQQGKHMKVE